MNRSIQNILKLAEKSLQQISGSSILDAELLLASILQKPRSFLYAHPEYVVSELEMLSYNNILQQRLQGKPIAYILGKQEFWSLEFLVNEHVLIPRPETECLIEIGLKILPQRQAITVADLGTGSGAIAIALASERPHWHIYATDSSPEALAIAKFNAVRLNITNVTFLLGDWCSPLPTIKFDAIICNPPYIAIDDPELAVSVKKYEPRQALIAAQNGLAAFKKIISQAKDFLQNNSLIMFEHGHKQSQQLEAMLKQNSFNDIRCYQDYAGLERLTVGYNR